MQEGRVGVGFGFGDEGGGRGLTWARASTTGSSRLAGSRPAASVSALCFANECSTYFQVGKVCKDQIVDYAQHKGQTLEEAEKWMGPYLGYDNSK